MADNNSVFITGMSDELPPWATETTAKNVESILEKTFKLQTTALSQLIKSAGGNSPDTKKMTDQFDEFAKSLSDETKELNKENPKRQKRNKEEETEYNKQKRRWGEWQHAHSGQLEMLGMLAIAGNNVLKTYKANVETYDVLTKSGLTLSGAFGAASNGFDSLSQLARTTGVSFTALSASMQKNSMAIQVFGVDKFAYTVKGATKGMSSLGYSAEETATMVGDYMTVMQNFTDVSKRSSGEQSAAAVNFTKKLMILSQETGQSTTAIMSNMSALSKSTEALVLQGQIGTDASEQTLLWLSGMKDQNLAKSMARMMTDTIKPLNSTFMSFQKIGQGGFAQKMSAFTNSIKDIADPALKDQMMKTFIDQNKSQIEYGIQQANFYRQIPELAGEAEKALEIYGGLQAQGRSIKKLTDKELADLQATNKTRSDLMTAWGTAQASLQKLFTPTIGMLEHLTVALNWLTKAVDTLIEWNDDIYKMSGKFKINLVDIIGGMAVIVGVLAGFTLLGKGLGSLTSMLFGLVKSTAGVPGKLVKNLLRTIGIGGKGAKAGKAAEEMTTSLGADGSGGSGKGGKGGKGGGGGGEGMLSRLGKGIGDLGKGIGAALGGLLRGTLVGLADGLKALGDPKVLLGVLALAGIAVTLWVAGKALKDFADIKWESIAKAGVVIVGLTLTVMALGALMASGYGTIAILAGVAALAGMGAALLVLGKAIQAVGTGLESITKSIVLLGQLNGDNLINVAKGVGALGVALASFGVGSAVGGIMSTVAGGFSKLFGDGSMLDQLKAFAAIGPNLVMAGMGITTISSSISLLSATLGSFKGLDTLQSIVSTINSIDIAKALTFAALGKFAGVSLPAPTTPTGVSNPSSPKLSTLDSPSKVSTDSKPGTQSEVAAEPTRPGAGIEKTAADGSINTALGYQSSILEQILLSTNSLVSVNKDILKYARVNT